MKKPLVALAAVLVLALCSCGLCLWGQPASNTEESLEQQEKSSLFISDEWPQNDVTAAVPKPSFSVGISSVSTGDSVTSVGYENVPAAKWRLTLSN